MKQLLLASLITLLAFGTACGQAAEPEPVASDGIQVHGHWTVTVTNPDGTMDAVHEFDNELVMEGRHLLVDLLTKYNSFRIDKWAIRLKLVQQPNPQLWCKEFGWQGVNIQTQETLVSKVGDLPTLNPSVNLSAVCTVEETVNSPKIEYVFTDLYYTNEDGIGSKIITEHQFQPCEFIELLAGQHYVFIVIISFE